MNFENELSSKVTRINQVITSLLPEEEGLQAKLCEAANYSVQAGGKRLRPLLMLESFHLCGGVEEQLVYPFAAALECIHTYSLVHDDLPAMDNDRYRRGKLTTHARYGEDFGILAGDALLNYAYELMFHALTGLTDPAEAARAAKAGQIISRKAGIYGMVGGQSLDVALTGKPVSKEELDFIFQLKTAALIEASFMAGAALAGASQEIIDQLERVGNLIGIAFQIQDDILDLTSTQEVLGKPINSDERNQKTTYVSLYGMEKAREDVRLYSAEALQVLHDTGENPFLEELVTRLISREK